jgi:hypothetical protein
VNLPSDISATDRYFAADITKPDFILQRGSTLVVPNDYGITGIIGGGSSLAQTPVI